MSEYEYITAIGQDSHRFIQVDQSEESDKKLVLGGIIVSESLAMEANSDGDVILHALTNAVSGITGVNILGKIADNLCQNMQIKNSEIYLAEGLKYLGQDEIRHVSITVECLQPHLAKHINKMKENIARIVKISPSAVGITATTGEKLTDCGRGYGISVFCVITVRRQIQAYSD